MTRPESRVDPVAKVPKEVAALVRKLRASGMNHDSIATKLGIPIESVERVLGGREDPRRRVS